MEKILKNISSLTEEVQISYGSISQYSDISKVFRAFLDKVERLLLKGAQNDLMSAFDAMREALEEEEEESTTAFHLASIVVIQTIGKLGES